MDSAASLAGLIFSHDPQVSLYFVVFHFSAARAIHLFAVPSDISFFKLPTGYRNQDISPVQAHISWQIVLVENPSDGSSTTFFQLLGCHNFYLPSGPAFAANSPFDPLPFGNRQVR
jgi:hypothetical protein